MMPYDPTLYPANWRQLATALKTIVGSCQRCGAQPGELKPNRFGELKPVVLTVAHVNHDPHNPDAILAIWCAACHLRYDSCHEQRYRKQHGMAVARGQLELFGDE